MESDEKNILNESNANSPLGVGGNMFYGALPILFELARKLRNKQTDAEVFLWNQLASLKYLKGKIQTTTSNSIFCS